jgi:glycosyltransferase involved in cell wall biosynthesis
MKLCFIANANNVHTYRWIAPLIQQKHTIYLVSPKPIERHWPGVEQAVDLTEIYNRPKSRFVYWGWWIRRYLQQINPDIVHSHQLVGPSWLAVMANYHPFVASAWGSDILVEPHKSALRRILLKLVLDRSDRLTVPSQLMYDAARSLGVPAAKVHLIPWGIETETFRPEPADREVTRGELGIPSNTTVVLCSRALSSLYNIDIAIEACKTVAENGRNVCLVLIRYHVNQDYFAELKELVHRHSLEQSVVWLPPRKTPREMSKLYRMADVTISIPSSEGYGSTVFEAMACGCPTIISNLPMFQNELQHQIHTLKVSVRDVNQTVNALENLLDNERLRRDLRDNGLRVARDMGVENRIRQTTELYDQFVPKVNH